MESPDSMKTADVLITPELISSDSLDSTQFMEVILSRPDGVSILFLQACQSGQQETVMKLLPQLELTSRFVLRALEKCWRSEHFELATIILTHFLQKLNTTQIEFRRLVQGLSRYRQEIPAAVAVTPTAYFKGMWRRQPPEPKATLLAYHRDFNLDSWQPDNHLYAHLGRWGQLETIEALAEISGPEIVYPPIRKKALRYSRTAIVEDIHSRHQMPLTDAELRIILERGDVSFVKRLRQCHLLTNEMIYAILSRSISRPSYTNICDDGHWRLLDMFLKIFRTVTGEQIWCACYHYQQHPLILRTMLQYPITWRPSDATTQDGEHIFTDWIKYLDFSAVYALITKGCPYYARVALTQPEISLSLTVRGIDVLAEHICEETGFPVKPGPPRNVFHERIDMILAALPEVFPRGVSRCVLEYV